MKDFFNNNFNPRPEDGLRIVSRCPVCQREHNPAETAILDEVDGAHLIYIKCKNCNSGVVATVSLGAMGISSLGAVTDLNSKEIMEVKDWGPINEDDVVDVYRGLSHPSAENA
ncbi:MAG: hypothetical protein BWY53_00718 [Parcubacteria group bacterium ADurb.Bin326]|mgnify:CR=1 FL=1|nr:MAG: hypothetical protein BWY53_00718 [Parcubacteria group bacterium ADurb.Bin326]